MLLYKCVLKVLTLKKKPTQWDMIGCIKSVRHGSLLLLHMHTIACDGPAVDAENTILFHFHRNLFSNI